MKIVPFILVLLFLSVSLVASEKPLITEALQATLEAYPNEPVTVWLYLDSTQVSNQPVALSPRSLARRAKVDPLNYLMTQSDYPIRPELIDSLRSAGFNIKRTSRWFKAVALETTPARIAELVRVPGLKQLDQAKTLFGYRDPDETTRQFHKPFETDALEYGASYRQNANAGVIKLQEAGFTGAGILIAMFDSGFNPNHPAFDSVNLFATWDFINNQEAVDGVGCPDDLNPNNFQDRHGTATWSVIGGYVPGTQIGAAFGADFALAKTEITCYGTEIKVEEYNWIAAAEWADSLGAEIITASLGYYIFSDSGSYDQSELDGNTALITKAADLAASKNILVVNSAGNENNTAWGTIDFPADGDSVIAVAAMTPDSLIASYSSRGPSADGRVKPDITTQGSTVWVAWSSTDNWGYANGTSFSAPLLAGSAALIMETGPELTAEEVRQMILHSGDRYDQPDSIFGYGIFNADRAADILHWVEITPIEIYPGESLDIPLETTGRYSNQAILSGVNLPVGIEVQNLGSGRGSLLIDHSELTLPYLLLELVATAGSYEVTTFVQVTTYDGPTANASAGPNPFRDSVSIFVNQAMVDHTEKITITVFNIVGEKVREIVNNSTGFAETVVWDGCNSSGRKVAPGMYLILVHTDVASRQLKLLKLE